MEANCSRNSIVGKRFRGDLYAVLGIYDLLFTTCAASLGTIGSKYSAFATSISILLLSRITIIVGHDILGLLKKREFPNWEVVTVLREMGIEKGEEVSYTGMRFRITHGAFGDIEVLVQQRSGKESDNRLVNSWQKHLLLMACLTLPCIWAGRG
jgi:hypothetical protein